VGPPSSFLLRDKSTSVRAAGLAAITRSVANAARLPTADRVLHAANKPRVELAARLSAGGRRGGRRLSEAWHSTLRRMAPSIHIRTAWAIAGMKWRAARFFVCQHGPSRATERPLLDYVAQPTRHYVQVLLPWTDGGARRDHDPTGIAACIFLAGVIRTIPCSAAARLPLLRYNTRYGGLVAQDDTSTLLAYPPRSSNAQRWADRGALQRVPVRRAAFRKYYRRRQPSVNRGPCTASAHRRAGIRQARVWPN